MKSILADLHIHTALSPCASEEMTPPAIVKEAIRKGLGMIAICDHNSSGNACATQKAAEGMLTVIAGMEITTAEEVHVLGLFPSVEAASEVSDEIHAVLPDVEQRTTPLHDQLLMDEKGAVIGKETKALYGSTTFRLSETADLIRRHHGLVIASHVDKPGFSVLGQLGLFPEDVSFDALEISIGGVRSRKYERYIPPTEAMITSSDSHFLCDIGSSCSVLLVLEPTFNELAGALRGRRCRFA